MIFSKKNCGWKICNGFTLLELIISIAIWTIIIGFSSSIIISIYQHKLLIDDINELSYSKSDIGIDLRNRILSDSVIRYEVKEHKLISYLKKNTSYEEKKVIEVIDGKLVENHYYRKNNEAFFLLKKVVISREIKEIEFITKGKLLYSKINIKGEEKLICI